MAYKNNQGSRSVIPLRRLVPIAASALLMFLILPAAWSGPEKVSYIPEICVNSLMQWFASWHLHPPPQGTAWPNQYLMVSQTQSGTYTNWTGSPWTSTYDMCTGPLTNNRWYIFLDCANGVTPDPNSAFCHFYPPVKVTAIVCVESP